MKRMILTAVATGVVLQFLVMPVVGFLIAKSFGFTGELAAGGLVHWALRKQFDAHKRAFDRILSIVSMSGICYTLLALTAPSRARSRSARCTARSRRCRRTSSRSG